MPPKQISYNQGDMWRMTRDAEQRVREMRERARTVAQNYDLPTPPVPSRENRNWSTETGRRPDPVPATKMPLRPQPEEESSQREQAQPYQSNQPQPQSRQRPEESADKKDTTIIQDIVGAVGVGEDTLLILGLILILINQKADTTLILALVYLLI